MEAGLLHISGADRIARALGPLAALVLAGLVLAFLPVPARATASLSFRPIGDSYVSESDPAASFGAATRLRMQSTPDLIAYLLFEPAGLPGSVTNATLRLKADTTSSHGFDLRAVADTGWDEQTLTYANAPAPSPAITTSTGAFAAGEWITLDVTSLVAGNGPVGFALTRTRTTPVSVTSKEAGAASAPELVVTTTGTAPPGSTAAPEVVGSAQEGRALRAGPGSWSGTEPFTFGFQWQRCNTSGGACADIPGADTDTYAPGPDDVGSLLRVVVTAANAAGTLSVPSPTTLPVLAAGANPLIVAAGDIACDPATPEFNFGLGTASACRQQATSDLFAAGPVSAVLALGDTQYDCGGAAAWLASYAPSWGRAKAITRPVPGNHEYQSTGATGCGAANAGAAGYFGYFGAAAGTPGQGWYSYDLGAWHVVALNSNCADIGGCGAGSPQEQWLRADLAASTAYCTLAYWHHPLFSSGLHAPGASAVRPLYQALYDYGVDVLLAGHDHNYERFAPQSPAGQLDLSRGIREFVVGTGGRSLYPQGAPLANSEVRNGQTFGVLELTLGLASYSWRFLPASNTSFVDAQSQSCDNPPHDTTRPGAPSGLSAAAAGSTRVDLDWSAASDDLGVTRYEIYRDGSLLASTGTPATSYTDATASPSTGYTYEVRARDAAGNLSFASNQAGATTAAAGAVAFDAVADARVEESSPNANFGASYLRADGGADPDVQTYLRFDLTGLVGTVTSAKLRLYAYTGSADGPAVFATDPAWTEAGLTWANRPPPATGALDDAGAISPNGWVEYDVTPAVTGAGGPSFALTTPSSDGVDFYSREAVSRPVLVVATSPRLDRPVSTGIGSAPCGCSCARSPSAPCLRRSR